MRRPRAVGVRAVRTVPIMNAYLSAARAVQEVLGTIQDNIASDRNPLENLAAEDVTWVQETAAGGTNGNLYGIAITSEQLLGGAQLAPHLEHFQLQLLRASASQHAAMAALLPRKICFAILVYPLLPMTSQIFEKYKIIGNFYIF